MENKNRKVIDINKLLKPIPYTSFKNLCNENFPELGAELSKLDIKRQEKIFELINNEYTYLNSLTELIQNIVSPLIQEEMIDEKEEELFFKDLKNIRIMNAKFFNTLRSQQDKNGKVESLESPFFDRMNIYREYVRNNSKRIELFDTLLTKEEKFAKFFHKCWKNMNKPSNFTVNNYFNLPMYHFTNQLGLITEIKELTSTDNKEYNLLSDYVNKMGKVISHFDNYLEKAPERKKLNIQIEGFIVGDRELVLEGQGFVLNIEKRHKFTRQFFLFDDVFLITQKTKKGKLKKVLSLKNSIIRYEEHSSFFRFETNSQKVDFCFTREEEAEEWRQKLGEYFLTPKSKRDSDSNSNSEITFKTKKPSNITNKKNNNQRNDVNDIKINKININNNNKNKNNNINFDDDDHDIDNIKKNNHRNDDDSSSDDLHHHQHHHRNKNDHLKKHGDSPISHKNANRNFDDSDEDYLMNYDNRLYRHDDDSEDYYTRKNDLSSRKQKNEKEKSKKEEEEMEKEMEKNYLVPQYKEILNNQSLFEKRLSLLEKRSRILEELSHKTSSSSSSVVLNKEISLLLGENNSLKEEYFLLQQKVKSLKLLHHQKSDFMDNSYSDLGYYSPAPKISEDPKPNKTRSVIYTKSPFEQQHQQNQQQHQQNQQHGFFLPPHQKTKPLPHRDHSSQFNSPLLGEIEKFKQPKPQHVSLKHKSSKKSSLLSKDKYEPIDEIKIETKKIALNNKKGVLFEKSLTEHKQEKKNLPPSPLSKKNVGANFNDFQVQQQDSLDHILNSDKEKKLFHLSDEDDSTSFDNDPKNRYKSLDNKKEKKTSNAKVRVVLPTRTVIIDKSTSSSGEYEEDSSIGEDLIPLNFEDLKPQKSNVHGSNNVHVNASINVRGNASNNVRGNGSINVRSNASSNPHQPSYHHLYDSDNSDEKYNNTSFDDLQRNDTNSKISLNDNKNNNNIINNSNNNNSNNQSNSHNKFDERSSNHHATSKFHTKKTMKEHNELSNPHDDDEEENDEDSSYSTVVKRPVSSDKKYMTFDLPVENNPKPSKIGGIDHLMNMFTNEDN